jgi:hypothetical protein
MELVHDLPDLWKQRHGISFPSPTKSSNSNVPRTPIRVLASAAQDEIEPPRGYFEDIGIQRNQGAKNGVWNSPSLRASPTDQLIAAILDGDVQGIRSVVRSKGEDLRSDFWHDLAKSVLPLHRALSGLHFHGSEKMLIGTIEVLIQLGADIEATDHAGNTVLHKAIQICTSKSVVSVVQCFLRRGADVRVVNKEGDTALHAECKR